MTRQEGGAQGRFGHVSRPDALDIAAEADAGGLRSEPSTELVHARDVLLIGLGALDQQREALTIVGAQAVLEHTRHDRALPLTLTKDADTSLAPEYVSRDQDIKATMLAAGFVQHQDRPGTWSYRMGDSDEPVGFDILVPGSLAGGGRRGARVPGQDRHAIGRAAGLELSLRDRRKMRIEALDASGRAVEAYLAGPAAMTCAKAYKLAERLADLREGRRDRVLPKDAGDVWRLMAVSDPREARATYTEAERDTAIAPAVRRGHDYLLELFGADGAGTDLAVRDLRALVPQALIRQTISDWMSGFREA
ncbi:MAG: hypothetical protein ACYDH5_17160 [Acidimicrobiales bacterium]